MYSNKNMQYTTAGINIALVAGYTSDLVRDFMIDWLQIAGAI
jgi:hypothetical protein